MNPSEIPNSSDYKNAHISKLFLDPHKIQAIFDYMKEPTDFLIFLGCPGAGKSYFCSALCNYLLETKGLNHGINPYFYLEEGDFFSQLRYSMDAIGQSPDNEITKVGGYDFLILDDVGTSQNTDYQKESLFKLLNERTKNRKPTVITSNYNWSKFSEVYDPRLVSRLRDVRNVIIEKWDQDLRQVLRK